MRFRNSSVPPPDSERRVKDNAPYHGFREVVPVGGGALGESTLPAGRRLPLCENSDLFSHIEKANFKDQDFANGEANSTPAVNAVNYITYSVLRLVGAGLFAPKLA